MLYYTISLSILILAMLAVRAIFRKKASSRVIYALWIAVAVRLCVPFSLFQVDFAKIFPENPVSDRIEAIAPIISGDEADDPVIDTPVIDAPVEDAPVFDEPIVDVPPIQDEQPIINDSPIVNAPPAQENPPVKNDSPIVNDTPAQTPSAGEVDIPAIREEEPEIIIPAVPTLRETTPRDFMTLSTSPTPTVRNYSATDYLRDAWNVAVSSVTTLWLIGSAVTLSVILVSWTIFHLRLRKNRTLFRTDGRIKIYTTNRVASPCVAGIVPAIYITPAIAENEKTLSYVLLHEKTHLKHGDNLWSLLRLAALVVHWWNPLIWTAITLSKQDAELACDEAVAKNLDGEGRLTYARIIVDMIPVKASYAVNFSSAPIKERIEMLMKTGKREIIAAVLAVTMIVCAVGCSFVSGSDGNEIHENIPTEEITVGTTEDAEDTTESTTEATEETTATIEDTEESSDETTEAEAEDTSADTTEQPEVTTPADTTAPQTTPAPEETTVATTAPKPVEKPAVTEKPATTDKPADTEKPAEPVDNRKVITSGDELEYEVRLPYFDEFYRIFDHKNDTNDIFVFNSATEFKSFFEKYNDTQYDLSKDAARYTDPEFYKDRSLVVSLYVSGSSTYEIEFQNITFDGKTLAANYTSTKTSNIITQDMCYYLELIEVKGIFPDDIKLEQKRTSFDLTKKKILTPGSHIDFETETLSDNWSRTHNSKETATVYNSSSEFAKIYDTSEVADELAFLKKYAVPDFYEKHTLIVTTITLSSITRFTEITKVTFDGANVTVAYNEYTGLGGELDAIGYETIFIDIEGKFPGSVNVVFERTEIDRSATPMQKNVFTEENLQYTVKQGQHASINIPRTLAMTDYTLAANVDRGDMKLYYVDTTDEYCHMCNNFSYSLGKNGFYIEGWLSDVFTDRSYEYYLEGSYVFLYYKHDTSEKISLADVAYENGVVTVTVDVDDSAAKTGKTTADMIILELPGRFVEGTDFEIVKNTAK